MPVALEELTARISEIKKDFEFVTLAARLRPRIGEVLEWGGPGEVVQLAKQFMNAKESRAAGVYGPLLIRLIAALERYLRMLVSQTVEQREQKCSKFDDVSTNLGKRNIVLTARVLSSIDTPRDHLRVDTEALITNLASCKKGNADFHLNSSAFSFAVWGVTPTAIDQALGYVELGDCWDEIGSNDALVLLLGTKGARATGKQAKDRLLELVRWRNNLAHGGDEEVSLSESDLKDAVDFVLTFCQSLDNAVQKQLAK